MNRKIAQWVVVAFLCTALGAAATKFLGASPAAHADEPHMGGPQISEAGPSGDDVATALGIKLFKYSYNLPKGNYVVKIWVEEWKRGGAAPAFSAPLVDTGGVGFEKGDILVALPNKLCPKWTTKVNTVATSYPVSHDFMCTGPIVGTHDLPSGDIQLGKETILKAMWEGQGPEGVDFSTPGFEKKFDRLVLIKALFKKV